MAQVPKAYSRSMIVISHDADSLQEIGGMYNITYITYKDHTFHFFKGITAISFQNRTNMFFINVVFIFVMI